MRRLLVTVVLLVLAFGLLVPQASAHVLGPCNDGSGNVAGVAEGATGRNYATHHISAMAKEGLLGGDGHIPGSHHGFSACDPSQR